MQVVVVERDPTNERVALLLKLLRKLGQEPATVPDWQTLRSGVRRSRDQRTIIVPDTRGETQLAEDAIAYLSGEDSGAFLVYVADTIAPDLYKRLVRTERGEWVSWQSASREIADLMQRLTSAAAPAASAKVVSFLPSTGGAGNTTLALETGYLLSAGKRKDRPRVAVIDLDFQSSTLADALDLEPRLDISEIVDRPERLDDRLIDIFTSRHSSHFDVFSSPTRLTAAHAVAPPVVFALLDGLSKRYDMVLVDLPHHWSSWIDNVLQGSDAVVVTGGSTVPAVKQLTARVQHLDELGIPNERALIVVNQCEATLFGRMPRRAQIDRALTGRAIVYAKRDVATATQAANTGRPIMEFAPRRPLGKSIRQIAQWVQAATGETESRPKAAKGRGE